MLPKSINFTYQIFMLSEKLVLLLKYTRCSKYTF